MPTYHSSIVIEGKEHRKSMRSISHTVANISLPIPRLPPQPPQQRALTTPTVSARSRGRISMAVW